MTISTLSKANATQYKLVLHKIPVIGSTIHDLDTLRLNIFNVILPGINLDMSQMPWQGLHTPMHQGGINFDPLTINFVVDGRFANWKILFDWLISIANNKDKATSLADEYVTDASLLLMDNWDTILFKIVFKNLWITSLGELTFSIRDGETHIECSSVFTYDRYEVS